ncbi:MAG: hypothetical protein MOGMAGMI_00065 [Candidatus Omnitrophica bacterium]|nr:hypothetical protein [Candidatus Omnitrophota bacterium]
MSRVRASQIKPDHTDERYVWFTSMGLTIGLAMVAVLLGIVVYNGTEVFWPKRVARIELSAQGGDAGRAVVGEIVKRRERKARAASGSNREWQLYVANKDKTPSNFIYIEEDDVRSVTYPDGVLVVERMEYGDAIGTPLRIETKSGETIEHGSPGFDPYLERALAEAGRLRAAIRVTEKDRIGAINGRMEELRIKERSLSRKTGPEAAAAAIAVEKAELSEKYEGLAAEARKLRSRLTEERLVLALADGRESSIPFGQAVGAYYANRIGTAERLGHLVSGMFRFLIEEPREANTEGGVFPAIFGTFAMTLLMSVAVMPFGVLAAIYLREYAKQGLFVRAVRIAVNNLAGVPSIVFGVFGLGFFVYFVGGTIDNIFFKDNLPTPTFGTGGILWASLTLALMTVPVVIVATEEALAAVSRGVREGSLACGASKWQTIQRVVLPASAPGILTGLILAMARGAGEVAPLMLVGVVKLAPSLPIDGVAPFVHMERKFMHLGFHIYDLGFQSPDSEAAKPMVFATTLLLIILVVILNLSAIIIRERLRRKYATGAF